MEIDQNKITVIKPKKGFEYIEIPFNCHMTLCKKAASIFLPKMAMIAPMEMSKSIIREGSTHIEFKINLPDNLREIVINTIHKYNFKLCINDN